MDAAVAALLGAAIGAVVPAVTGYVAHRAQGSRDLLKSASELGLADWKGRLAFGEKAPGKYVVWPLQLYVSYHAELLRLISKDELVDDNYLGRSTTTILAG